ncbi:TIR domain-containing protein [Vibrio splendidus]
MKNYRHKVFMSYHHDNDQSYRNRFEAMFATQYDIMVSKSVQIGDIDSNLKVDTIRQKVRDEYLRDSTVTIVLVGSQTWQRKHVDWEIGSSIRHTQFNLRSGLIGILLPSYQRPFGNPSGYRADTIPPRLSDNVNCGFAKIYNWSDDPKEVQSWIHEAFERRNTVIPDNSYPSFINNRSGSGWIS